MTQLTADRVYLVQGTLSAGGEAKGVQQVVVVAASLADCVEFVKKSMPALMVTGATTLADFEKAVRDMRESLDRKPGALPCFVVPGWDGAVGGVSGVPQ